MGERRLAAIMFTDMAGYTSLGQRNEALSLALVDQQRGLIRPVLARHHGNEIKTMGDAFLVEFPSALDAVQCAYDIQRAAREFNIPLPPEERIRLRIGIHLGDVIESQGDISGDAVNVASRIHPLAEDGGVCLTRQVYDQVRNKFELPLASLGARPLKNVSIPMEIYKMEMPWNKEKASQVLRLDKKRVAVLPFANLSPDPTDEYFADGVTEELITTLSGVRGLTVIARTSVMKYKGAPKGASEIGGELNAGTLIEGSVRKAGNKVRITAQLVDAVSQGHLWAQNYDKQLDDIFAIQSEIAEKITGELKIRLGATEKRRLQNKPTMSTEAYTLYLKGRYDWNQRSDEGFKNAMHYFEQALKADPNYALAYVGIADCYHVLVNNGYLIPSEGLKKARENVSEALRLNNELGEAHATLGAVLWASLEWAEAEKELKRSLELKPSYASAHHWHALSLASAGRLDEALAEIKCARELDPNSLIISTAESFIVYLTHDYDRALELQRKVLAADPKFGPGLYYIFFTYLKKSMISEAAAVISKSVELWGEEPSGWLAHIYAAVGEKTKASEILEKAETSPLAPRGLLDIAMAHYYLGEIDRAFEWLEKAVEQNDKELPLLKVEPEYDTLRNDPRFEGLLKRIGLA